MADKAVELINVTKRFAGPGGEDVVAVDNMQLSIENGEFFSLLGPSGCGKTTTLRMIGGFEMPTTGEILIGGELQGFTPAYQRPVNTVFQNYALFPHMTVAENVAFGLQMTGVPRDEINRKVDEALDMVQMAGFGTRKPNQLSGGQQQRVALARALINRPKVLLLDEPLGALDLKLRKEMQLELKALQERMGITFVYVTHDQEEALTMSDRIAVMNHGTLLQIGTAHEIYEQPTSRFVSDFIGETNYINGEVVAVRGDEVEVRVEGDSRIKGVAGGESAPEVGQQVAIAFRPEKTQLNAADDAAVDEGGDVAISARVVDVVYTGVMTTYHVSLPNGEQVMVRYQNTATSSGNIAQVGDAVTVAWPLEASRAFFENTHKNAHGRTNDGDAAHD